jgi:hypothetical protein
VFDARDPYERRMWHYESWRPLSIAQIIAAGSVDAATAALLWVLIEHRASLIVAGPTDPTPGIGKTTTLNALLEFLPEDTMLAYCAGMWERFDFLKIAAPERTCIICNEVSDHLPIYMWGRVARRFLMLPEQGYIVATTVHADTIDDVVALLANDVNLPLTNLQRLGLVVNIGLVGRVYPPRRRFLTVHFLRPTPASPDAREVEVLQLATWNPRTDRFSRPSAATLAELAQWAGTDITGLSGAVRRRTETLARLAADAGQGMRPTRRAIAALRAAESEGAHQDQPEA